MTRVRAADAELCGVGRLGDVVFEGTRATVKLDEAAEAAEARPELTAGAALAGCRPG